MGTIDNIIKTAESLKGIREYSAEHRAIIQAYNNHSPLARGYKVTLNDAWCMVFVSYCFMTNNALDALGKTECGCQEYLDYARQKNMTTKNPARGDIIMYDWNSDGRADHVGIIMSVGSNGYINVIEGNKSDSVGIRNISKNSDFIVGYIHPAYSVSSGSDTYSIEKVTFADSFDGHIAGYYKCTASDFLALRYGPSTDYGMIDKIEPGDTVRSYGYYTDDWYLVVYNGMTGFAHKNWLKKI